MAQAQSVALDLPFHIDGTGRVAITRDLTRQIALRVRSVIGTGPGERVMRPTYGAGAARYVFDVDDPATAAMLTVGVKDALTAWEPAIIVDDVSLVDDDPTDGTLTLAITYRLVATGEQQTAVVAVSSTASYGWPSS